MKNLFRMTLSIAISIVIISVVSIQIVGNVDRYELQHMKKIVANYFNVETGEVNVLHIDNEDSYSACLVRITEHNAEQVCVVFMKRALVLKCRFEVLGTIDAIESGKVFATDVFGDDEVIVGAVCGVDLLDEVAFYDCEQLQISEFVRNNSILHLIIRPNDGNLTFYNVDMY